MQSRIHHVDNLTRTQASLDAAEENLRTARVTSRDAAQERARLAELGTVEPLRPLRDRLDAALKQQAPAEQRATTAQGALLQAETAARTTKETLESSRSAHNSAEAVLRTLAQSGMKPPGSTPNFLLRTRKPNPRVLTRKLHAVL
jgi:hypothetical protein